MLVVVGGSGVGKSTLIERALLRRSDRFAFLADTTTRARRATEPLGDGQACPSDKRFVSRADFADLVHEQASRKKRRRPVFLCKLAAICHLPYWKHPAACLFLLFRVALWRPQVGSGAKVF